MTALTIFEISSEEDAYDLLQRLNRNDLPDNIGFKFVNWPKLDIRIVGDGFNATITPTLMKGFIEFQQAIYRSFALAQYGSVNINKLTAQQKKDLEINVRVDEGSSKFAIDFQAALEKFVENVSSKLSSKQVIGLALVFATAYFGNSAYKNFLEERKAVRVAELKSEEQKKALETMRFQSEQETKRMQILAETLTNYPEARNVETYSHDAKTEILKTFRTADTATVQGVEVSGDVATELVKKARRESHEIRLDGSYRILLVDTTQQDGFKVRIRNTRNNEEFSAIVHDETFEKRFKTLIQEAEWSKKPVQLMISARELGGEVKNAEVLGAQEIKEENDSSLGEG